MTNGTLWEVVFYEGARGQRPVNDWLSELETAERRFADYLSRQPEGG